MLRYACHPLPLLSLGVALTFGACSDRELRGTAVPSTDGQTYLVVDDDNGGHCGPIKVDGAEWPHAVHSAGPIAPGLHKIACGDTAWIAFEVRSGTAFHFDYWGP